MLGIPLPKYFFTKEHPLKTSNKITRIPLPINQFSTPVPRKFKIDKTTYSKLSQEQRMTLVKISLHCILNEV